MLTSGAHSRKGGCNKMWMFFLAHLADKDVGSEATNEETDLAECRSRRAVLTKSCLDVGSPRAPNTTWLGGCAGCAGGSAGPCRA